MDFFTPIAKMTPLPGSFQELRRQAIDYAKAKGLPTRKDADWKYTSVKEISENEFVPAEIAKVLPSHDTLKAVGESLAADCHHIVFINGILDKTLSDLEDLPAGVSWSAGPEAVLDGAPPFENSFQALNLAYQGQGLRLEIAGETFVEKPVQIHFHTGTHGAGALMVSPRVKVRVGPRSVVKILESHSSEDSGSVRHFTNAVTEIEMASASKVLHVRSQQEGPSSFHIGETTYKTKSGCDLTSLVVSTGARMFRHHLKLPLEESGVNARVLGLSVSSGSQHVDNTTDIDHRVGACNTEQIYKSLIDGESRAVFNGRIYIRPFAQKANSSQLNNNLLLSKKGEADSQPQLMIEADDVKAAHGSTVGHLSVEELFYLRSRGISRDVAIPLLAYGFLADLLEVIEHEGARKWVEQNLKRSFGRLQLESL